jgi:hypothetical protein
MRHARIASVYFCLIISSVLVRAQAPVPAGPIRVEDIVSHLKVVPVPAWQSFPAVSPDQLFTGALHLTVSGKLTEPVTIANKNLSEVAAKINETLPPDWKAAISLGSDGLRLTIEPKGPFGVFSAVVVEGNLKRINTPPLSNS